LRSIGDGGTHNIADFGELLQRGTKNLGLLQLPLLDFLYMGNQLGKALFMDHSMASQVIPIGGSG
jgi:hypothetical protein